ncbi:MAG: hypothetical protein LBH04_04115 [Tannerellaceae bacterium]|jgi:hypothetical protein|nr:hypothetical protein [Tannerellaceae bacterium]
MNRLVLNTAIATVCLILLYLTSCNNDFIEQSNKATLAAESISYLFPGQKVQTFTINIPNTENNRFTIRNKPDWLNMSATSGQLVDGKAAIECLVEKQEHFSDVGIYYEAVIIDIDNIGAYSIPVAYVNEGAPIISITPEVEIKQGNRKEIILRNVGKGILIWTVTECPEWLAVDEIYQSGVLSTDGALTIPVQTAYNQGLPHEDTTEHIRITSNDPNAKETAVIVHFKASPPHISCNETEMNFDRKDISKKLYFINTGNGNLTWEIKDIPEWLSFNETEGTLFPYTAVNLTATCNRNIMPPGENSAVIHILTNDPEQPVYSITVTARNGTPATNVKPVTGRIADAHFDKANDMLYIATSQPNRFFAYDVKTRAIVHETELPKPPTCFSMDGTKAIVGHDGCISYIDLERFAVIKIFGIEANVYDIEWGNNNWVCYTSAGTNTSAKLAWINTDSGKETTSDGDYISQNTLLGRIPGQNCIIASRTLLSPSGLFVFDAESRRQLRYFHEEIDCFWFSPDGQYMYNSHRNVFSTASFLSNRDPSSLSAINTFKYDDLYNVVGFVDHNVDTHSIWALVRLYTYNNLYAPNTVLQFEDNDFSLVKTYMYDDYYQATLNGITDEYEAKAYYVFSNKAGTELVVLKSAEADNDQAWAMEFILVSE